MQHPLAPQGFTKWSSAVEEDQAMTDWLQTTNLTAVLHQGSLTPTWKTNEGLQEATLDRVFVTQEAFPSLELSVQWYSVLQSADNSLIFNHALLTLLIQPRNWNWICWGGSTLIPNQDAGCIFDSGGNMYMSGPN